MKSIRSLMQRAVVRRVARPDSIRPNSRLQASLCPTRSRCRPKGQFQLKDNLSSPRGSRRIHRTGVVVKLNGRGGVSQRRDDRYAIWRWRQRSLAARPTRDMYNGQRIRTRRDRWIGRQVAAGAGRRRWNAATLARNDGCWIGELAGRLVEDPAPQVQAIDKHSIGRWVTNLNTTAISHV